MDLPSIDMNCVGLIDFCFIILIIHIDVLYLSHKGGDVAWLA